MTTSKGSSALACNLTAIPTAERPSYNELVARLRAALHARTELADGYAFQLNERSISLPQVAEWIGMERRCWPFLIFHLEASGETPGSTLQLTGPAGVKTILETEFPFPPTTPLG